jgi:uncharacterized protein YdaU (DUF1376 family)
VNFYKRYMGDYARDTAHLSLMEHGAYTMLLDTMYATEKPLPSDRPSLYRICRATSAAERKAVDNVADQFFPVNGDGSRHNPRVDKELADAHAYADAQRERALKKWGGESDKQKRSKRLANARAIATHTPEQWVALMKACGNKCLRCSSTEHIVKDHIVPIYLGGSDGIENLQPLCHRCNSTKGPESADIRPDNWMHLMHAEMPASAAPDAYRNHASHSHSHKQQSQKLSSGKPDPLPGFIRFWTAWPKTERKQGKGKCLAIWKRKRLEDQADAIVAHVEKMAQSESWRTGFDPMPETYLNGQRWDGAELDSVGKTALGECMWNVNGNRDPDAGKCTNAAVGARNNVPYCQTHLGQVH